MTRQPRDDQIDVETEELLGGNRRAALHEDFDPDAKAIDVEHFVPARTGAPDVHVEDARELQVNDLLTDLNRMRSASVQLNGFVTSIIQDSSDRQEDETLEEFHRRLRHDLRTPLNAIKGYGELLIEDMGANGDHPLRADLVKLKDSADQLLSQID